MNQQKNQAKEIISKVFSKKMTGKVYEKWMKDSEIQVMWWQKDDNPAKCLHKGMTAKQFQASDDSISERQSIF